MISDLKPISEVLVSSENRENGTVNGNMIDLPVRYLYLDDIER